MHAKPAKRFLPIVIAVAAIVLAAAGFAVAHFANAHSHAQQGTQTRQGSCVKVSNDVVTTANCGGADATHQVGKVLAGAGESCPGGEDSDYYEVTDSGTKMCLLPKVVEGTCFELDGTFGRTPDCSSEYSARVTEVVAGKADEAACGEGGALVFAEPPTTMCLSIPRTR